jgi:outer membrane protein assembly factor BamB
MHSNIPRSPSGRCAFIGVAVTLLYIVVCSSIASDWPQYRGPNRNGVSDEKGWLDQWPANGPAIAWRAKVGLGFSSIVVAKGRNCTAGHESGRDTVFCFDAVTGNPLWKHSYKADLGDKFFEGGTTGTPSFDGDRVYWLSRWGDLFCFEAADGKIVWSKNIVEETKARIPTWGFTGAPLIHESLLVLNVGDAGMALDKSSGKLVWKSADKDAGYSTPLPMQRGGEWLALLSNSENYLAVNLQTGQEAWRFRWLTEYGVNAADPIVSGDQVFISTGYGKGATLINLASGKPDQVWKNKALRTQLNPAVLVDGYLYGADGDTTTKAALKCLELATGTEKWSQANFGSGAVIMADGKLIALSGAGELMVAPASPTSFQPVARAQVLGGKCWTAPVLANGLIYCRNSRGDLAVVDVRRK